MIEFFEDVLQNVLRGSADSNGKAGQNRTAQLETGDIRCALAGNGAIVVTKADGQLHQTGTAYPLEHDLKRFESD